MYIEVEKRLNAKDEECWRVKICENHRVNGKPRKKTIRNVGTCHNERELELTKKHALKLMEIELDLKNGGSLFDATSCYDNFDVSLKTVDHRRLKEEKRISEGVREVYGDIFESSGFSSILERKQSEILKEVVLSRIEEPCSKRKTQEILERDCNFKTSLDSIYRMISSLSKRTDELIKITAGQAKTLFEEKLDILFFDVTTLYFESFIQDELRDFGYSKDNKFKETQVVLALASTREGAPVGYKIFPGKTAETKTLVECLNSWGEHIDIHRVVFVADRGMFNYENLSYLEKSGYEFIVAATLRKMSAEVKNKILDQKFFSQEECKIFNDKERIREIPHKVIQKDKETKIVTEVSGKLIVCHSTSRSKKDFTDREKLVLKIKKVIGKTKADAKKLITNKGYLKFTKLTGDTISSVNENKVTEDQRWDGIHGIFTNADLSAEEILGKYRDLWQIELAFRISKNDLSMRPIYHFKKERIEGHIAICFMALFLIKKCQVLLGRNKIKLSPERIKMELERVQSSIVCDKSNGIRFRMPSNMSDTAKSIYKALGIDRNLSIQRH